MGRTKMTTSAVVLVTLVLALALAACDETFSSVDGGGGDANSAGRDTGTDAASPDGAADLGRDAGVDRPLPDVALADLTKDSGSDSSCVKGATRACYTGKAGTAGVGPCKAGTQTCAAGGWGACTGQVTPVAESCDLKDNDCNGKNDDNLVQTCYTGKAGTAGVGPCKAGTQACTAGMWGACTGEVTPVSEACDSLDNDCNGTKDDSLTQGCYTGKAGTAGVGLCKVGPRSADRSRPLLEAAVARAPAPRGARRTPPRGATASWFLRGAAPSRWTSTGPAEAVHATAAATPAEVGAGLPARWSRWAQARRFRSPSGQVAPAPRAAQGVATRAAKAATVGRAPLVPSSRRAGAGWPGARSATPGSPRAGPVVPHVAGISTTRAAPGPTPTPEPAGARPGPTERAARATTPSPAAPRALVEGLLEAAWPAREPIPRNTLLQTANLRVVAARASATAAVALAPTAPSRSAGSWRPAPPEGQGAGKNREPPDAAKTSTPPRGSPRAAAPWWCGLRSWRCGHGSHRGRPARGPAGWSRGGG